MRVVVKSAVPWMQATPHSLVVAAKIMMCKILNLLLPVQSLTCLLSGVKTDGQHLCHLL